MCVACEDLGFLPGSDRVRFYSTIEAVEADFSTNTEAHRSALAFFSQSPRAPKMAIGEVFLDAQPAMLVSAPFTSAEIAALELVADGTINVTYDIGGPSPEVEVLSGLDFDGVTTVAGIAAILDAALSANLVCSARTLPGGSVRLEIKTVLTGDSISMFFPVAPDPNAGTYVGGMLNLTAAEGAQVFNGYTSAGISDELSSIANAANNAGEFIYGWALGSTLRDTAIQQEAATWAVARNAVIGLVSNDLLAKDAGYLLDIGYLMSTTTNKRAFCVYHDNAQMYPDVSILAYMLHVNYRLQDSTVTAKFKQLPGISTVQLTESEWSILQNKGYNTYTAVGVSAQTYRDGGVNAASWFLDTVINLDNFTEDLSVAMYNVFLRNKKIPYTREGQMILLDAARDVGNLYIYNGTFADREVADTTTKSGSSITNAVQIIPTPISSMSAADRASRIGPPIQMIVQEAGAIHSIAINVDVVS
jgi:hypothetical protein